MKRLDQDMIDLKLLKGEASQTVVIDCRDPQDSHIPQNAMDVGMRHANRIKRL